MGPHHGFPERPSAARPSRQLLAMIHVLQVAQLVQQNLVEEILVGVDGPHTPFEDGLHICEPWCWYIHDVCWYICHYLPTFFWCFFFFCGNSWDSYSGTMELGFTHKLCLSHDADLISARFDSNACVRRVNPEHSKSRKHT